MLTFILKYSDEYRFQRTGAAKAKLAMCRRMLSDLGIDTDTVYEITS